MNWLQKIFLSDKNSDTPQEKEHNKPKKRLSAGVKRNYQYRVELDLNSLKSAVDSARALDLWHREDLLRIYDQVIKDAHLAAQMRTALFNILQSDYYLTKNGKPDTKATELIQAEWFDDFVSLTIDAEFWGHSLIEFGQLNQEGRFEEVNLIPRLNVRQEFGLVVPEYNDIRGVSFRDHATRLALIEIGDMFDLGLLEIAAREVILKNYARTDWSQASEKFGMPLLKILTDSQDEKELDKMEEMASKFASNGYLILNRDDEAEVISTRDTDFYKIYQQHIELCDSQISKIINGQTGTSDEKAFVGSAEVHERILNDYTRSRLRRIQHIINNQLLPFLVWWGYSLQGYKFQYIDLLNGANKDEDPEKNKAIGDKLDQAIEKKVKEKLTLSFEDFFA